MRYRNLYNDIKEDLISNRKVHISEMSKINSLRVKSGRVNGLDELIRNNVSLMETFPLDISDQKNYKW